MKKVVITCDICGREVKDRGDRNHYTYMIYKYIDGLYVAQDLCSLCYMKVDNALEEVNNEN